MINKVKYLLLIHVIFYTQIYGQKNGVQFDNKLSWLQIIEKAQKENKYIFVDCFATWCGPCKEMEKSVFPLDSVGKMANKNFVSIRLQMDQNPNDKDYIKSWYSTAKEFKILYDIGALPSYLFFLPNGKIVHKDVGFKDPHELLNTLHNALNPEKQCYTLLRKFDSDSMKSRSEILSLINTLEACGNRRKAIDVAAKFKKIYLDSLNISQLATEENFNFIARFPFLITSHDNCFNLFLNFPDKCDSIRKDLSNQIVTAVIQQEEIDAKIYNGSTPIIETPNWDSIYKSISLKYGQKYSESQIPPSRKRFAFKTRNWNEYARIQNQEIQNKTLYTDENYINYSWDLNMSSWNTYLACDDTAILRIALSWVDLSISLVKDKMPNPSEQYYDTKARILYKLGEIPAALENEQKAIDVGIQMAELHGETRGAYYDDYLLVLKRMKKGEPISDLR